MSRPDVVDSEKENSLSSYGDFGSSLRDLPRLRSSRRKRASSWDKTGGNEHMTRTPSAVEPDLLHRVLLKMYWDGEDEPSVLVPVGCGRSAPSPSRGRTKELRASSLFSCAYSPECVEDRSSELWGGSVPHSRSLYKGGGCHSKRRAGSRKVRVLEQRDT
jgi:hypothetical protein